MYLELAVALATWYNKNYISLDKIEKAFDYGKYEIAERIILWNESDRIIMINLRVLQISARPPVARNGRLQWMMRLYADGRWWRRRIPCADSAHTWAITRLKKKACVWSGLRKIIGVRFLQMINCVVSCRRMEIQYCRRPARFFLGRYMLSPIMRRRRWCLVAPQW